MQLRKIFRFESAHVLPHHQGKCARMHGHSYKLEVAIRGPLQNQGPAAGMIEDFETIECIVKRTIIDAIDHQVLNELVENPTAELVTAWIWEHLQPALPALDELVLWETPNSCAILRKSDFHHA